MLRPVTAGIVSGLVAFTSSFVVVLAGLHGVGATPDQAASGLLAVTVAMGLASILLASWTRLPITIAWSTPGAALLATFVVSLRAALAEPSDHLPAGVTVLIAASGIAVGGISAAFWALLAGLALRALLRPRRRRA